MNPILSEVLKLAKKNNQTIGRTEELYITLEQLEIIIKENI